VHALVEQSELSNPLSWAEMGLDSFADLVASKMVAWVERGAPRVLRMPPCSKVLDLQGDEQNDNCEYYYSA
jgi:hypothetical protein